MKVVITTTFKNVNQEWLDDYINRLEAEPVLPGCMSLASQLREKDIAVFRSKDPSSDVTGETEYRVERLKPKGPR